jgi:hypothetical protein
MTVKILRKRLEPFPGHCSRCGCDFSYELEDVDRGPVKNCVACPNCDHECVHSGEDGTLSKPRPTPSRSSLEN